MSISTVGSREARQNWRELLDAAHTGTDTIIERNGKPLAVLIPYQDYLALQETLNDLRATRRVVETYEALKLNPDLGRTYTEIRKELERKGLLDE